MTLTMEIIRDLVRTDPVDDARRGPAQDVPFDLIIWYIEKTIPTFY